MNSGCWHRKQNFVTVTSEQICRFDGTYTPRQAAAKDIPMLKANIISADGMKGER